MDQNGSKIDVQGTFGASSGASWWLLERQWRLWGALWKLGGVSGRLGGVCLPSRGLRFTLFGRLLVALRLIVGTLWRHFGDYW